MLSILFFGGGVLPPLIIQVADVLTADGLPVILRAVIGPELADNVLPVHAELAAGVYLRHT